jgi:hypothetical protein
MKRPIPTSTSTLKSFLSEYYFVSLVSLRFRLKSYPWMIVPAAFSNTHWLI